MQFHIGLDFWLRNFKQDQIQIVFLPQISMFLNFLIVLKIKKKNIILILRQGQGISLDNSGIKFLPVGSIKRKYPKYMRTDFQTE